MKKFVVLLIALAVNTATMATWIDLDDGGSYTINDGTYQNDNVELDYFTAITPGTHVDLVDGGLVWILGTHNNSTVTMSGGSADILSATENASITMTGGSANIYTRGRNNADITMTGGSTGFLEVYNDATFSISGGSIGGAIKVFDDAIVYLDGTNFKVNGVPLQYGDKVSDFATLINNDYYGGTITGNLANGTTLNNSFSITVFDAHAGTGNIIIGTVPEPMTICLLGLGGLVVRRRKK